MSLKCKGSIIICFMVICVLGCAITITNITVIWVLLSEKKLRNSQAIYKISIAFGDLLVGLVVIPNTIIFQYLMFMAPRPMGPRAHTKEATSLSHLDRASPKPLRIEEIREPGGGFASVFNMAHINAVGLVTFLSIAVSIYTLLAASYDRFMAVSRPMTYSKHRAKKEALRITFVIWIVAFVCAGIPLVKRELNYSLVSAILVTSESTFGLVVLLVSLGIPLIALWGITISTFCSVKSHARMRRRLRGSITVSQNSQTEKRMTRTLSLMVGVFSCCIIPVLIATLLSHFFENIFPYYPRRMDPHAAMIYNSFEYFTAIVLLSNSLWNFFIYSARAADFRQALKGLKLFTFFKFFLTSLDRCSRRIVHSARKVSQVSNISVGTRSSDARGGGPGRKSNGSPSTTFSRVPIKSDSSVLVEEVPAKSRTRSPSIDGNLESTFGSFVIEAGAERLFLSVIETVEPEGKTALGEETD